jgi:PAS domain S-box-containing protein
VSHDFNSRNNVLIATLYSTHDYIIKLRQALHQAEEKISKLNRSRGTGGCVFVFMYCFVYLWLWLICRTSGTHGGNDFVSTFHCSVSYTSVNISAQVMEDTSPFETSFMKSTVAMALTGVDGHFIACNDNFTTLSGYARHEVESTSVFNLTLPEEMTQMFNVVSSMLSFSQSTRHFSKTFKFRDREETCFVSMWLIRELDGEPLYFQIMIVPLSDCAGHIGELLLLNCK